MKFSDSFQLILVFSVNLYFLQANASGNETDRLALLKFREGIAKDPYGVFNSWNDSLHFCNWNGIKCENSHQRVVSLVLSGQNLLGTASSYIGNLSFLRILDLRNNSLHGKIPAIFGKLIRLQQLHLNNNSLTGEIPGNLSHCFQLRTIHLTWNNLVGKIPEQLGSLTKLEMLQLGANRLTGNIPSSLANLSSLLRFSLPYNHLEGNVPNNIGRLTSLTFFNVGANKLSGTIPASLFNISSIDGFYLTQNRFGGTLPDGLGITLPNIVEFGIGKNQFSGPIPTSLSNASLLEIFDIKQNNFLNQVPPALGDLKSLVWLDLGRNNLGSKSVNDLSFLGSLRNCSNLEHLAFDSNHFGDVLPNFIANFSVKLNTFRLGDNHITGIIPTSMEKLFNLFRLEMKNNLLTGGIPYGIGKLEMLQGLYLNGNNLSGKIPSSIGNLTRLVELDLSWNELEGKIPLDIGGCKNLYSLDISQNKLYGAIPQEILMTSLSKVLNLSHNLLTGNLPIQAGKLRNINKLDVSENNLSGEIPTTIEKCESLEYLYLQGNSFQGNIPASFTSLKALINFDLSRNNLTGTVPEYLQNFPFIQYLNISFNDLEGEVPMGGVFRNTSAISVTGNRKLCGGVSELHLPKCSKKSNRKDISLALKLTIILILAILFGFSMLTFALLYWTNIPKKKSPSSLDFPCLINVSYQDLYKATAGFSPSNLVGSGSFGSVYKGLLQQIKKPVAIKVLNLQQKGASKSLTAELYTLTNTRHRNLVKIITFCSSLDYKGDEFKALVFECMENGNSDEWLHPNTDFKNLRKKLNLVERLNITIDVASSLLYLHSLCEKPIIHCDIKPSNVLLDDEMVGHLGDFGLSKILSSCEDESQSSYTTTGLIGSIGYATPEYGMGWEASKEGDMYCFGILVLEIFTGKRPTDEMFREGLSLHEFVKAATMAERGVEIVDEQLVEEMRIGLNCVVSVLQIGLMCSVDLPSKRMNVEDVFNQLCLIKKSFLGN